MHVCVCVFEKEKERELPVVTYVWNSICTCVGLAPQVSRMMGVEYISPVVAYMCHESCTDNGTVIEVSLVNPLLSRVLFLSPAGSPFPFFFFLSVDFMLC